ncbi:hypothetical protein BJ170DRAFT_680681 [Xylariales sp. AK1849]|nr:hypothetical protein BJ170DRAFT_680681 [Xylariales sp. AK1849]
MSSQTANPHVLIVGAGLGGLTLAQCLRKQGISFEIFERDAEQYSRPQGWAIGLHTMLEEFESSIPSDMPDLRAATAHLLPLKLNSQVCWYFPRSESRIGVQDTPEHPCLRANRTKLRNWLSTNLGIQWDKRVKSVENTNDKVSVYFEDGTAAVGDILVGADGINSVVREHLLQRPNSEVLNIIPTATIIGETCLSRTAMERQLNLGHSAYAALPPDFSYWLFTGLDQARPDGKSGDYYWFFMMADPKVGEPDHWLRTASQDEKLAYVKMKTASLEPKFREVIEQTPVSGIQDTPFIYRDGEISRLPAGRIALLGDAAHPMTPFRGEGGVHAIIDALKLSKVLGRAQGKDFKTITTALGTYQAEVLERGVDAVRKARGAQASNIQQPSKIFAWGQPAVPIPEENITL